MSPKKIREIELTALALQMSLSSLPKSERTFLSEKIGFSLKEQYVLRDGTYRMIGFIRQYRGDKVGHPEKLIRKHDAKPKAVAL